MKDDLSPRKKTVTGPVEIIGNIMEISNLLNKKALSEKDVQTEGVPESPQVARKEISLPIPCAESSPVSSPQEEQSKAEPASPAVARIAPHRVEIGTLVMSFWVACWCGYHSRVDLRKLFSALSVSECFCLGLFLRFPGSQAETPPSKRCDIGKNISCLHHSIYAKTFKKPT